MQLQQDHSKLPTFSHDDETDLPATTAEDVANEAEDTDPPLDEEDLEENNLTVEEADQIVWNPPQAGSSGPEEKDITD